MRRRYGILAVAVIVIVTLSLLCVEWNPEKKQYQFQFSPTRELYPCAVYKFHQYAVDTNIEVHDGQRIVFLDSEAFFEDAHTIYLGNVSFPVGAEVVGLNMAQRFEHGSWAHGLYTLDLTGQDVFLLQCL